LRDKKIKKANSSGYRNAAFTSPKKQAPAFNDIYKPLKDQIKLLKIN